MLANIENICDVHFFTTMFGTHILKRRCGMTGHAVFNSTTSEQKVLQLTKGPNFTPITLRQRSSYDLRIRYYEDRGVHGEDLSRFLCSCRSTTIC